MEDRKVIKVSNLPTRIPFTWTAVVLLGLDRLGASQIWWGVVLTVLAFLWVGSVAMLFKEKQTDIFKKD